MMGTPLYRSNLVWSNWTGSVARFLPSEWSPGNHDGFCLSLLHGRPKGSDTVYQGAAGAGTGRFYPGTGCGTWPA